MVVTSPGIEASRVMVSWLLLPHTSCSDQVCNFPAAASLQQLPAAVHSRFQTAGTWALKTAGVSHPLPSGSASGSGNPMLLLPTTHASSTHVHVQFLGS